MNIETDGDVKQLAEILETVADQVPKLVKDLFGAIYSAESGAEAGKSVGNFYNNLIESGIPNDVAIRLTERYMFSVKDIVDITKKNNEEN